VIHTVTACTTDDVTFTPALAGDVISRAPTSRSTRPTPRRGRTSPTGTSTTVKREYTAKAAVGHMLVQMDNVNAGIHTIHERASTRVCCPCGGRMSLNDETDTLLSKLYEHQLLSGTPLRRGPAA
jgi:hypothetical protein